jgi:hypothetical protein
MCFDIPSLICVMVAVQAEDSIAAGSAWWWRPGVFNTLHLSPISLLI